MHTYCGLICDLIKVKVKEQGYRFVLSQLSRSLFLADSQQHIILPQSIIKCTNRRCYAKFTIFR